VGLVLWLLDRRTAGRAASAGAPGANAQCELVVLTLLFLLVYSASFMPFLAAGRFRIPLVPFLLMFSAYAVWRLTIYVSTRNARAAALCAVSWLVAYGLASVPVVAYEPDLGRWHLDRASAYTLKGQPEQAIAEYKAAIRANPRYPETYAELGSLLVTQGEFDDAIANYRKAIALNPSFAELRRTLAELLFNLDRVDEAIVEYRAALDLSPDNAEAWYDLGRALAGQGLADEGLAAYRRALEIDPGLAEARVNLGVQLQAKGRVQEAEQAFRQAIDANPNLFEAHYNLANVLAARGEIDEAIRSLSTALHIQPDNIAARQAWQVLKERQRSGQPPSTGPAGSSPEQHVP
jgi:tetratricopeptide (TPR) repeat protein